MRSFPASSSVQPGAAAWRGSGAWRRSSSAGWTPRWTADWAKSLWAVDRATPARSRGGLDRLPSPTRGWLTRLTNACWFPPRWRALRAKGARPQRLLWASTGVKDKTFDDTRYVVELAGPDTVNTMPEETLQAVVDHGQVQGDVVRSGYEAARAVLDGSGRVGVDMTEVADALEARGIARSPKAGTS